MLRFARILAAATLALTASAQTNAHPPTQFPTPHAQPRIPDQAGCPVGLAASQRGQPATLWTTSQQDSPIPQSRSGNGVHVDIAPSHIIEMPKAVLGVELTIDYLPLATRTLPLTAGNPQQTLHKTYILKSGQRPAYHLEADLLVGQTSGIERVNLTRVDFADGSTWQAPTPNACATKPSLYLPVSTP